MAPSQTAKLGIIAGGGALPSLLARACRETGRAHFVLGLRGFADAAVLGGEPDAWIRLGEAGLGFDLMRRAGVSEIVMAGAVRRAKLDDIRPDAKTASFFARVALKALGDDGLLTAVVAEIEREGFRVIGPDQILSGLLAPEGTLSRHAPDAAALADVAVGAAAARELGRRDLGQAVIVAHKCVQGEEGPAGTDALIVACGTKAKGGVLVKMKKPQQERRVDLPAIGVETVRQALAAGLRGIAVEAGQTLIIDREAVAAAADAAGIFVIGVSGQSLGLPDKRAPFVYIIAAEPSGDQLGSLLIRALKEETGGNIRIAGIGGSAMTQAGPQTLFDPAELALLGIFEVIPKAGMVLRRVRETVADIEARKPDVLVTIDSWGFTGRIHERLSKHASPIKRVRYVAPQVWAWRPGRARQLSRWIHHLMVLFPFEPPYFTKYGLPTSWVGHPVLECGADKGNAARFRECHGIAEADTVVTVLPGSRNSEVSRLLRVFGDVVRALQDKVPRLRIVIPTVANVEAKVRAETTNWPVQPIIVTSTEDRFDAFAASKAALAASGTVSLELAMAGVAHVIAYRINALSALALRFLIKTKFVNLVNVLLNREAVHERLQGQCNADVLTQDMLRLLSDTAYSNQMKADFREALTSLSPAGVSPSREAARAVLKLVAN